MIDLYKPSIQSHFLIGQLSVPKQKPSSTHKPLTVLGFVYTTLDPDFKTTPSRVSARKWIPCQKNETNGALGYPSADW